jgi:ribose/xylose/arabinose/galactoside ABC-type transport system permease subunit
MLARDATVSIGGVSLFGGWGSIYGALLGIAVMGLTRSPNAHAF